MPQETIFHYIANHIDENGRFTENTLPDIPYSTVPRPLGMQDAIFYTQNLPPAIKPAAEIYSAFQTLLHEDTPEKRQRLYKLVDATKVIAICDIFYDKVTAGSIGEIGLALAKDIFYHTVNTERMKFALLLLGIYGLQRINDYNQPFWQDIITVSRCEEFTVFLVNGCHLNDFQPQADYWQLASCTSGWGKIAVLQELQVSNEAQRLWLIINGFQLDNYYPQLAPHLLQETHLQEFLQREKLDDTCFQGSLAIVNNLLQLLVQDTPKELEEGYNLSNLVLAELVYNLLRHAGQKRPQPQLALQLLEISNSLHNLADEEKWTYISTNNCHILIAQCDALIFKYDWRQQIEQHLNTVNGIDYTLADLAYELEIDIWPRLYGYFTTHLQEIELFPYLLACEGTDRSAKVLQLIEEHLDVYTQNPDALLVPLRYLKDHPGEGQLLLSTVIRGMYDFPRGLACSVLHAWGIEWLTPEMEAALKTGLSLGQHPAVIAQIEALLAGKPLEIPDNED